MSKRFLRSETVRFLRLGKNRRKLQKWRRPRGRHNKIRKGRAGYPLSPSVGYKKPRAVAGLIHGKLPIVIHNLKELARVDASMRVVLSRSVGAKKRIELLKKAHEMHLEISGVKTR